MEKIERIKVWEKTEGIELMASLGFKSGDHVLDFGSNIGHYTFPLARLVEASGSVIAYDHNENALSIIETYKQQESLHNIQTLVSHSNTEIPIEDESLDGILFFDILHHLKDTQEQLLLESLRVLKKQGKLVILPFHYSTDDLAQLIELIIKIGFTQHKTLISAGPHFEHYKNKLPKESPLSEIEKGDIYIFLK
jgi:ubiquinone/menaquinone biosynthesis C-methylase UbiE